MAKRQSSRAGAQSQKASALPSKAKAVIAASAKEAARIENAPSRPYQNGLGDAVGFTDMGSAGFPFNQGNPWTVQLSNVNTIFKNLRWYLISNFRQVLSELYVEIGLVQTIVDVPTDDAFRGGVEIKSKQLDEDQIDELQTALERDDDYEAAATATKWNRLFGGAGIIVITDQDPSTPLDLEAINEDTPLEFRAVDMWELYFDVENTEGPGPQLEQDQTEHYSYYGVDLHKSRVFRLTGLTAPSFIRPRLRGWGYSVVEKLVRSINQYLKSNDLGFEVLDEFKLDVYKIKNLTNSLLSPQGEEQIRRRIQLANWQKNYQNAVVMDSEDEFDHKQLSFSGLAEAMAGIRMQVASDMRMPLTKLFGISAAGFNSGEDDIEVYNAMVESEVRTKIKWHLLRMIEIKCQKLFGFVPDDLRISFKPLRILTAEQEENVKTQRFNRLLQAKQAGEVTRYEFREGCNKDNLLSITLDNAGDSLNPDDPDIADHVEGEQAEEMIPGEGDNEDDSEFSQIKKPSAAKKGKAAPEAKVSNDWDESKHPRRPDGKFGKGGSDADSSGGGDDERTSEDEPASGETIKPDIKKKFKGFETKPPERDGSKTQSLEDVVLKGGRGYTGKPSAIPYSSPKDSTCNLVGFVAFGKAPKKAQEQLNRVVQSAEVILTSIGIRMKTPIDFVCQGNLSGVKNTQAEFVRFRGQANPRINVRARSSGIAKSVMHEVGHAIDYAMQDAYNPASQHYTRHMKEDANELVTLHTKLAEVVKSSDYYTQAAESRKGYLEKPTEVFARGFEVYSYAKGLRLVEEGKLPPEFVEDYKPDIFKTKNEKIRELEVGVRELYEEHKKATDHEAKEKIYGQWKEARSNLQAMRQEKGDYSLVPLDKQREYMSEISKVMDEIMSKDTIKNILHDLFIGRAIEPFSALQSLERAQAAKLKNSAAFDRASYAADGGDAWIDARKRELYENPKGKVNPALWAKAKEASKAAFGKDKWQFMVWFYLKHGGKFGQA